MAPPPLLGKVVGLAITLCSIFTFGVNAQSPTQSWMPAATCANGYSTNPNTLSGGYYDAYGALWNVSCASDSTGLVYDANEGTNGGGILSCFRGCDARPSCTAFYFIATGTQTTTTGSGHCWYKYSVGTYTLNSANYATANLLSNGSPQNPCPYYNNTRFTACDGAVYNVYCGFNIANGNSLGQTQAQSQAGCMSSCDNTASCTYIVYTYGGGEPGPSNMGITDATCYLKSNPFSASNLVAAQLDFAIFALASPATTSTSCGFPTVTSTPVFQYTTPVATTTSSIVSAVSTSSSLVSSSSSVSRSSSVATSSSSSSAANIGIAMGGAGTSSSPSTTTSAASTTSSAAALVCTSPVTPSVPYCTGANAGAGKIGVFTDACGANYTVYCGTDSNPGASNTVNAATMADCMQACDNYAGCQAATYASGGACYLKTGFSGFVSGGSTLGVFIRSPNNPAIPSPTPAAGFQNASTGCGSQLPAGMSPGGATTSFSMINPSDGNNRSWTVHIPLYYSATAASPVILGFPGNGETASNIEGETGFSDSGLNPYAIAVYVNGVGLGLESNPAYAPGGAYAGVDDLGFVTALIANVSASYCVDKGRIFATGHSNGGGFCGVLACDPTLSKTIAAFAPNSGAFYTNTSTTGFTGDTNTIEPLNTPVQALCTPGRNNVPILEFHGTNDQQIHYTGDTGHNGKVLPAIPHWVTDWSTRQGYTADNVTTPLTSLNSAYTVTKYEFGNSSGNLGIVTHYQLGGWSHTWPNPGSTADSPVNAGQIALQFFYRMTNNSRVVANPSSSSSSSSMSSTSSRSSSSISTSSSVSLTSSSSSSSMSSSSSPTSSSSSSSSRSSSSSASSSSIVTSSSASSSSSSSSAAPSTSSPSSSSSFPILTSSSSSSAAASSPSTSACANYTVIVEPSGNQYTTYCGYDTDGTSFKTVNVPSGDPNNFQQCAVQCDQTAGCGAWSWVPGNPTGGNCFLKSLPQRIISSTVNGIVTGISANGRNSNGGSVTTVTTTTSSSSSLSSTISASSSPSSLGVSTSSTSSAASSSSPTSSSSSSSLSTISTSSSSSSRGISTSSTSSAASSSSPTSTSSSSSLSTMSSSSSSSSLGVSTSSTSSAASASSTVPTSTSGSSSLSTMSSSSSSASQSASTSATSSAAAAPSSYACVNGSVSTDSTGTNYTTYCGYDATGYDLNSRSFSDGDSADYSRCETFCTGLGNCGGWTWSPGAGTGGNCYPKSSSQPITLVTGNPQLIAGLLAKRLSGMGSSSSSSSAGASSSSAGASSSTAGASSSSAGASSSTAGVSSSTAGVTTSSAGVSTSSAGASTSSAAASTSSVPAGASSSSAKGSSSSSTMAGSPSSSAANMTSSSSSSVTAGVSLSSLASSTSSSSSIMAPGMTSSTSPAAASSTASSIQCPGSSNGTTYTDDSGTQYVILCDTDSSPGAYTSSYVPDFQSCIDACSAGATDPAGPCVATTYAGGLCYLKSDILSPVDSPGHETAVLRSVYEARFGAKSISSSSSSMGNVQSSTSMIGTSSSAALVGQSSSSDAGIPSTSSAAVSPTSSSAPAIGAQSSSPAVVSQSSSAANSPSPPATSTDQTISSTSPLPDCGDPSATATAGSNSTCADPYGNSYNVTTGKVYTGTITLRARRATLNDCLTTCDQTPGCKAANYNTNTQECDLLSDVTGTTTASDPGQAAATRPPDVSTVYTAPPSTAAQTTTTTSGNFGPGPVGSASLSGIGPAPSSSSGVATITGSTSGTATNVPPTGYPASPASSGVTPAPSTTATGGSASLGQSSIGVQPSSENSAAPPGQSSTPASVTVIGGSTTTDSSGSPTVVGGSTSTLPPASSSAMSESSGGVSLSFTYNPPSSTPAMVSMSPSTTSGGQAGSQTTVIGGSTSVSGGQTTVISGSTTVTGGSTTIIGGSTTVIPASSTAAGSPSSPTSSTSSGPPCPAYDNADYTDAQSATYAVTCNSTYSGRVLARFAIPQRAGPYDPSNPSGSSDPVEYCLSQCDASSDCVAISANSTTCTEFSSIDGLTSSPGSAAAAKLSGPTAQSSSSGSVVTVSTAQSSGSGSVVTVYVCAASGMGFGTTTVTTTATLTTCPAAGCPTTMGAMRQGMIGTFGMF